MKIKKLKSKTANRIVCSSCAVLITLSLGIGLSKAIENKSQPVEDVIGLSQSNKREDDSQTMRVSHSNQKNDTEKSTVEGIVDMSQYDGEGVLSIYPSNEIDMDPTYVNVKLTPHEWNQLKGTLYPKVKLEVEHDSNTSQLLSRKLTILEKENKKAKSYFEKKITAQSKIQGKLLEELESLNSFLDIVEHEVVKKIKFNHDSYQITVELNPKFVNLEQLSQQVILKKINKRLFALEKDSTFGLLWNFQNAISVSYLTLDVEVATSNDSDTINMITDQSQY